MIQAQLLTYKEYYPILKSKKDKKFKEIIIEPEPAEILVKEPAPSKPKKTPKKRIQVIEDFSRSSGGQFDYEYSKRLIMTAFVKGRFKNLEYHITQSENSESKRALISKKSFKEWLLDNPDVQIPKSWYLSDHQIT